MSRLILNYFSIDSLNKPVVIDSKIAELLKLTEREKQLINLITKVKPEVIGYLTLRYRNKDCYDPNVYSLDEVKQIAKNDKYLSIATVYSKPWTKAKFRPVYKKD